MLLMHGILAGLPSRDCVRVVSVSVFAIVVVVDAADDDADDDADPDPCRPLNFVKIGSREEQEGQPLPRGVNSFYSNLCVIL